MTLVVPGIAKFIPLSFFVVNTDILSVYQVKMSVSSQNLLLN
jgi:hypothetical protein